jgi:hypothetical protein
MKASLVAYDYKKLHKKSTLKIEKYKYVKGYPRRPATQIGSLEILGVNNGFNSDFNSDIKVS